MNFRGHKIVEVIELRGVYDGWSVAIDNDGTRHNRWANDAGDGPKPVFERRYNITEAFVGGEPANGRWV